jgi:hypothetical protein
VDQWWQRERRRFVRVDRYGTVHPPEKDNPVHTLFMVLGGGLGVTVFMAGAGSSWQWVGIAGFFLPVLLITVPAALFHERAERRYKEYQQLERDYQSRRDAIIQRHSRHN